MNIQLISAATTMRELQKKVDVISNNLANLNTTGYKRQEANFSDALAQSLEKQPNRQHDIGRTTPYGLRIGYGAKVSQINLRTEQGTILTTERPLDVMIAGDSGWFRIESEGKVHYTKDGSFDLQPILNSNEVRLVTSSGASVLDSSNRPITFNGNYQEIKINENGTVQVRFTDPSKQPAEFQLGIAKINRPNLLEKVSGNLFQLPGTEEELIENGTLQVVNLAQQNDGSLKIQQGAIEMSNVDLTEEMTELISTQRLIQSQGKAISFADDMMGLANTIRG